MKFARYWIPLILGLLVGSLLALKLSGTPMRDLLTATSAEASSPKLLTNGKLPSAGTPLAENERVIRFFSAVQETRALKRRSDLHSAIGDLNSQDMEPLINRIESLRWRVDKNELIDVILREWLEIDRAAAKKWIRSHPNSRSYQILWAKTEPEAALAETAKNPRMPCSEEIIQAAVEALATDADEKARLILQLPDSSARNEVLRKITSQLAATTPSAALKFAQNIPDTVLRSYTMTEVLMGWAQKDAKGAANEISTRLSEVESSWQFNRLLTNTIAAFASRDVNGSLEWIGTLPEHLRSDAAYSSAVSAWASKAPIEAMQWCVANGIDGAFSYPPPGSGSIVSRAMYSKPKETLQWIQSQPPGEMRDTLLERALMTRLPNRGNLISELGESAFQALESLSPESQTRVAAGITKANLGGDADPAQLFTWLEKFQDPALRAATIIGAAEAKGLYNQKVATDFSMQFDEGPDRNAALRGIANGFRNRDKEQLAADTALRITDQTLQLNTLDTFMVKWLRKDSKAATQWLKSATSIPPAQSAAWQNEASSAF